MWIVWTIPVEENLSSKEVTMAQLVEDWYKQMPIITRSYLTLSVLTTAGCALEVCIISILLMYVVLICTGTRFVGYVFYGALFSLEMMKFVVSEDRVRSNLISPVFLRTP